MIKDKNGDRVEVLRRTAGVKLHLRCRKTKRNKSYIRYFRKRSKLEYLKFINKFDKKLTIIRTASNKKPRIMYLYNDYLWDGVPDKYNQTCYMLDFNIMYEELNCIPVRFIPLIDMSVTPVGIFKLPL